VDHVDARPLDVPFLRRRGIGRFAASLVPELAAVAAERDPGIRIEVS